MTDEELMDKVLPLAQRTSGVWWTEQAIDIQHAQRVADWERVKPLIEAAELQVLNFQRQQASGKFLGDDDHEAWTALEKALAQLGAEEKL